MDNSLNELGAALTRLLLQKHASRVAQHMDIEDTDEKARRLQSVDVVLNALQEITANRDSVMSIALVATIREGDDVRFLRGAAGEIELTRVAVIDLHYTLGAKSDEIDASYPVCDECGGRHPVMSKPTDTRTH